MDRSGITRSKGLNILKDPGHNAKPYRHWKQIWPFHGRTFPGVCVGTAPVGLSTLLLPRHTRLHQDLVPSLCFSLNQDICLPSLSFSSLCLTMCMYTHTHNRCLLYMTCVILQLRSDGGFQIVSVNFGFLLPGPTSMQYRLHSLNFNKDYLFNKYLLG